MRHLPDVTLACIDTANPALALRALALSMSGLRFGRTVLLTDALPAHLPAPPGLEVERIESLRSREDYSRFVLKDLLRYVDTRQVLVVQWDGYVVNAQAWEDAFLGVDYIGAPWASFSDGMRVGNGGFSLRSRKLLQALADPRVEAVEAEDLAIGRTHRPWLEQTHGIRFADVPMAERFAFEAAYPIGKPFGFHGLFNFCRTVAPADLAELVAGFSDAIVRSQQCRALLRNCAALAQWPPAIAIARRMLAADPADGEAAAVLASAQAAAARGVGVGRNDPCPCGSGKRYKQCHGAANAGAAAMAAPLSGGKAGATPDQLVQRGMEAHRGNDLETAERHYREALAGAADHPYALHYLGVVFYQRERLGDALPLLDRAADLRPQEPEFHNNRGQVLAAMQRHADARAAYERALALNPAHVLSWNNLGLTLQLEGNVAGAVAAFRRALALAPDFAQGHWNLALALLLQGEYAEGFAEYEWRLRVPEFAARLPAPPGTRWDGRDPAGKTLLLTVEQGLGDTLQNLRFASMLATRGARVIAAVPPALHELSATVPGVAEVVATTASTPAYDAHVSVMSLPHLLGVTATTIPATVPYMRAATSRANQLRHQLDALGPKALNIGVAWTGAANNAYNARRTCPLAMFDALFRVAGVRWFSLQREADPVDAADAPYAARLISLPERNDFDGTAALVSELDLVISVDTSLAHLAGAMGKPVWILLPFVADWRWLMQGTISAWYSTATLFRQSSPGDWSAPLAAMETALGELLSSSQ